MCNSFHRENMINIVGETKKQHLFIQGTLKDIGLEKGRFVTIPAGTSCVSEEDYNRRKLSTTWVPPVRTVISETCSGVIIDDSTTVYHNEILVMTSNDKTLGIPIDCLIFEKKENKD